MPTIHNLTKPVLTRPPRRRPPAPNYWLRRGTFASISALLVAGAAYAWEQRRAAAQAERLASEAARPLVGAVSQTVYERGLVVRNTGANSVLREHGAFYFNVTRRVSSGLVLGFVSPWSLRGEELAWRFASKFTHLSPMLYGVDASGRLTAFEDEAWLATLRQGLSCPACPPPARLVPLITLAGADLSRLFGADEAEEHAGAEHAGRLLVALLHAAATHSLDGYVLDAHTHLASVQSAQVRARCARALHLFVQLLAAKLSELENAAELLLLVPPHPALFSPEQFAQLAVPLGGIIVSTTNYSAIKGDPGPSSPLGWMREALGALQPDQVTTPKLLATLPMLGWDFPLPNGSPRALDAASYLALLKAHRPARFEWLHEAAEHSFTYELNGTRHAVYYPSLKGVAERLGMLRNLGVGVALWELGTGLDYFFDLL